MNTDKLIEAMKELGDIDCDSPDVRAMRNSCIALVKKHGEGEVKCDTCGFNKNYRGNPPCNRCRDFSEYMGLTKQPKPTALQAKDLLPLLKAIVYDINHLNENGGHMESKLMLEKLEKESDHV